MKDFRIVARIYNNQLRERREATGMTACAFARSVGVNPTDQCALESMKVSPLRKDGAWTNAATKIAAALAVHPSVLWPDAARTVRARVVERRLDAEEVAALMTPDAPTPLGLLEAGEEQAAIADALQVLTPQEQRVIRRRFGIDDGDPITFRDLAEVEHVSPSRLQQVEAKALRKLRKVLETGEAA